MELKLFDSELKIMEILWEEGDMPAKEIAEKMKYSIGWSKTTTYTVIKKCIEKGAIQRIEPKFVCHPMATKEEIQQYETTELINRMYDGATDQLVALLIKNKRLSTDELNRLKKLINQ